MTNSTQPTRQRSAVGISQASMVVTRAPQVLLVVTRRAPPNVRLRVDRGWVDIAGSVCRIPSTGGAVHLATAARPSSNVAVYAGVGYFVDDRGSGPAVFDTNGLRIAPGDFRQLAFYGAERSSQTSTPRSSVWTRPTSTSSRGAICSRMDTCIAFRGDRFARRNNCNEANDLHRGRRGSSSGDGVSLASSEARLSLAA